MKTRRVCIRCESPVKRETKIKEYPFYCPRCDENMYRFETCSIHKLMKIYGRKPQGAKK